MIALIVIAVIVVLLIIYFIATYNSLVDLRNKVKDSWSQIDVVLKNRNDLIPNLVETVKGYAKHEKTTLDAVITARNKAVNAKTNEEEMKAAGEVTEALGRLFALAENYPDLKANQNFMDLQNKLNEVEEKIRFARQFYNDTVLTYQNKLEMFPSNIVAKMFGFKPETFFEATEEERKNVEVKF
ncbi:MAG TPA: LemA family protein [Candidatus Aphodocola excrementigallinarum]|uniref:LemA family protein n=1 Tax=Candidatus Aphodocola excrementigallinarum TaxID=2840670 RepID=A0A9D1IRN2_9FIRM|nr:LemA family protein [Candidatus Aphodocola excrementigallinarum]